MGQEKFECSYSYVACKRKPLESSEDGYCIFHAKVEDKDEEKFREALREYVNEIRTKKLDYSFVGFVFVGAIDFHKHLGVVVLKNAEFRSAEFHGDVKFWETEFQGSAGFALTKFHGDAEFYQVEFQREVRFALARFECVSFREARFRGEARFNGTSFRKKASFVRTRFEGGADFKGVVFGGDAEFDKAQLWPTSRISVALAKGRLSFAGANLENVSLTPLKLHRSASIDFAGALLRNTQMKREDIKDNIADEREKHFSKAREIYLLLKNNFHSIGRYNDESWAFRKEKEMERKSYFHRRSFLKWLSSMFLNILYGYGEKPLRVIRSVLIEIVVFAFLFMILGIRTAEKAVLRHNILGLKNLPWRDLLDCLYFSTVTFTTLGYGDFRPLEGWSRLIAGVEAFTGAFMMALFVYTFARRIGGR